MAPDRNAPGPDDRRSPGRDRLRPRDWAVAIGIALVLVLIIAAIFRNGLAYMYG